MNNPSHCNPGQTQSALVKTRSTLVNPIGPFQSTLVNPGQTWSTPVKPIGSFQPTLVTPGQPRSARTCTMLTTYDTAGLVATFTSTSMYLGVGVGVGMGAGVGVRNMDRGK